jgi:hypothetical protein
MKTEAIETVETCVIETDQDQTNFKKTAVKAIKRGTLAAKQAAVEVAVSPVKLVNHAVYGLCYGVAYGAVYGALVLGSLFPDDGVVRKGLHEGLETAVKDFDTKHQEAIIVTNTDSVSA